MENKLLTQPVSRRTIAKGAAWSVPALGVALAAPASAASPAPCDENSPIDADCPCVPGTDPRPGCAVIAQPGEGSCKHPGNSDERQAYHAVVCFKSNVDQSAEVIVRDVDGGTLTGEWTVDGPAEVPVGGMDCVVIHIDSTNSANVTLTITFDIVLADGTVINNVQQQVTIAGFPPCKVDDV